MSDSNSPQPTLIPAPKGFLIRRFEKPDWGLVEFDFTSNARLKLAVSEISMTEKGYVEMTLDHGLRQFALGLKELAEGILGER